ncbi:MAG: serine hydrolase [bacterium]|nr:serine hydrolase [bacterium]
MLTPRENAMLGSGISPRKWMVCFVLSVFGALLSLAAPPVSAVTPAQVDALFAQWNRNDRPGVALAVIENGQVTYKGNYGMANLDWNQPIDSQTEFHLASVSKQFTAFCILLLEDRGLLSLDDDVREYLPELHDFGQPITIAHLMHHTSGIRDYFEPLIYAGWNLFTDIITPDHVRKIVYRQRTLNFDPGAEWLYSNTGYFLLGEIVQRVSGQTLAEFAKAEIFDPLGMTNTRFDDNDTSLLSNRAESYAAVEDKVYRIPVHFSSNGEAGVISNIDDFIKWNANAFDPIVGNAHILALAESTGRLNNGADTQYAAGLLVIDYSGNRMVLHDGSLAGFRTLYARLPDRKLSVIVLSNDAAFDTNLSFALVNLYLNGGSTPVTDYPLHESIGWGGDAAPVDLLPDAQAPWLQQLRLRLKLKHGDDAPGAAPLQVKPTPDELAAVEGRYYSEECDGYIDVALNKNGELEVQMLRGGRIPFKLLRRTLFQLADGYTNGRFQTGADGSYISLTLTGTRSRDLKFIRMKSPSGE